MAFDLVILGFTLSHLVSRDLHRFYWVLHWFGYSSNGFYWVLLSLTWFLGICIGFTGFYMVLVRFQWI